MYTGYIYKWENKINGKVYIGQTMNRYGYKERWSQHRYQAERGMHNNHFHNAIRKYGVDSFDKELLEIIEMHCNIELKSELDRLEIRYIEKYNSFNNGYNSTIGGEFNVWNSKSNVNDIISKLKTSRENSEKWQSFIQNHSRSVVKINIDDYSLIARYDSCIEAANKNGARSQSIRGRCRGEVCTGSHRRKSDRFEDNVSFMYLDDYMEGLTINQVAEKYGNLGYISELPYGLNLPEDCFTSNEINMGYDISFIDYGNKDIIRELLFCMYSDNCPIDIKIDMSYFINNVDLNKNEKIIMDVIKNGLDKREAGNVLKNKYNIKPSILSTILSRFIDKILYSNNIIC